MAAEDYNVISREMDSVLDDYAVIRGMLQQEETMGFSCVPGDLSETLDRKLNFVADVIKVLHPGYKMKISPPYLSEEDFEEGDDWDRSAWEEARVVRTCRVLDATGGHVFSIGVMVQLWTASNLPFAEPDQLIVMIAILQEEVKDGKTEFFFRKYKK